MHSMRPVYQQSARLFCRTHTARTAYRDEASWTHTHTLSLPREPLYSAEKGEIIILASLIIIMEGVN